MEPSFPRQRPSFPLEIFSHIIRIVCLGEDLKAGSRLLEKLSSIYDSLWYPKPNIEETSGYGYHLKPFAKTARQVCSAWRRLVDSDESLSVSRIFLYGSQWRITGGVKKPSARLSHHPRCDLDVFLSDTLLLDSERGFQIAMDFIKEYAHRLRHLGVTCRKPRHRELFKQVLFGPVEFKSLQMLEFERVIWEDEADDTGSASFDIGQLTYPTLAKLHLRVPNVCWDSPDYSSTGIAVSHISTLNLRILSTNFQLSHLPSVLQKMPLLEDLTIFVITNQPGDPGAAVTHGGLKKLRLKGYLITNRFFLSSLDLPNLKELQLQRLDGPYDSHPDSGVHSSINISLPSLESLTINAFEEKIAELLSGIFMPNLSSWVASNDFYVSWYMYVPKRCAVFPIAVPRLKHLEFRGDEPSLRLLLRCLADNPPEQLQSLALLRKGEAKELLPDTRFSVFGKVETLRLQIMGCDGRCMDAFYSALVNLKRLDFCMDNAKSSRCLFPRVSAIKKHRDRDLPKLETIVVSLKSKREEEQPEEEDPDADNGASSNDLLPALTTRDCRKIVKLASSCKKKGRMLKSLTFKLPVWPKVQQHLEPLVEDLTFLREVMLGYRCIQRSIKL